MISRTCAPTGNGRSSDSRPARCPAVRVVGSSTSASGTPAAASTRAAATGGTRSGAIRSSTARAASGASGPIRTAGRSGTPSWPCAGSRAARTTATRPEARRAANPMDRQRRRRATGRRRRGPGRAGPGPRSAAGRASRRTPPTDPPATAARARAPPTAHRPAAPEAPRARRAPARAGPPARRTAAPPRSARPRSAGRRRRRRTGAPARRAGRLPDPGLPAHQQRAATPVPQLGQQLTEAGQLLISPEQHQSPVWRPATLRVQGLTHRMRAASKETFRPAAARPSRRTRQPGPRPRHPPRPGGRVRAPRPPRAAARSSGEGQSIPTAWSSSPRRSPRGPPRPRRTATGGRRRRSPGRPAAPTPRPCCRFRRSDDGDLDRLCVPDDAEGCGGRVQCAAGRRTGGCVVASAGRGAAVGLAVRRLAQSGQNLGAEAWRCGQAGQSRTMRSPSTATCSMRSPVRAGPCTAEPSVMA